MPRVPGHVREVFDHKARMPLADKAGAIITNAE
ncbi:hypothetical protein M2275_003186 [Rhodococcus opacus]|nr:hypothetical protein [Rhodococcus opacus]